MPPADLEDWVALNLLPGMGPVLARRALERHGDPGTVAHRLPPSAFAGLPGLRRDSVAAIREARRDLARRARREIRAAERHGIRLVPSDRPDYPAALAALPDAPIVVSMRGSLTGGAVRIAVVGSRRPTPYGRRVAAGMASALAARGVEIVSGGARGIDACAHSGAIESGMRTVAVLGSGLLRPYPAENAELFEKIAANGAVLSEFPLETGPVAENFPRRNRLISALAAAVVVVEATVRSGSLITAGHALEQGREVMAVPGPVSSERSEGCHRLIQQGAKLVQRADDVLDELSPMYRSALRPVAAGDAGAGGPELEGLDGDEAAALALLEGGDPVHVDVLADRASFGIARLHSALFGLELRGAVEQLPGRYYLSRLREGS